MDDKTFYYDLAKFEANIMATRSNFMLVFQSMLFTTLAILDSKAPTSFVPQQFLICLVFLGLITSIIWLFLNIITKDLDDAAFDKLKEIDGERVAVLMRYVNKSWIPKSCSITNLMAFPFPVLIGLIWLILLYQKRDIFLALFV